MHARGAGGRRRGACIYRCWVRAWGPPRDPQGIPQGIPQEGLPKDPQEVFHGFPVNPSGCPVTRRLIPNPGYPMPRTNATWSMLYWARTVNREPLNESSTWKEGKEGQTSHAAVTARNDQQTASRSTTQTENTAPKPKIPS